MGKGIEHGVRGGAQEIGGPAFVATLSIWIVFLPMFLLSGVAKFLFVPLGEAVVFAMLASYMLSRTVVPTMAKALLRGHEHDAEHATPSRNKARSEEHTSELQSHLNLVCRLLLEKKN